MITVNTQLCRVLGVAALSVFLTVSLVLATTQRCDAQTKSTQTNVAALVDPLPAETARDGGANNSAAKTAPATPDPDVSPALAKQLAAMQAEIEQLKAELRNRGRAEPAPASPTGPATSTTGPAPPPPAAGAQPPAPVEQQASDSAAKPEQPEPSAPFAYADWTWLNGNARNKDAVWDSKFFTPEVRFDTHFVSSFNHPKDDTLGGSTEIFRSNEIQLEQISFGGDFH